MNLFSTKNILILSAGLFVVACATTTGVLPKGDGSYTINVSRGDMAKVKLRAYQHAEKFCAEKSANGIEVSKEDLRVDPASPNMGIIDLDFKCKGPVNSDFGKKEIQKDQKKATGQ
ncbi:hypothetical protein [Polynucleobacter sphagniphilus]|uniref:hypothetical protein n=1 Tax=Polynucleobacter sphagniphilus TaxID=1743169 RepID=UPI0024749D2A|nr:hypothetical protein [Polynucleobacter sphagniphilus]MDH6525634.1 hypothetical protein [Polynucleobacter sphagniphilus]